MFAQIDDHVADTIAIDIADSSDSSGGFSGPHGSRQRLDRQVGETSHTDRLTISAEKNRLETTRSWRVHRWTSSDHEVYVAILV